LATIFVASTVSGKVKVLLKAAYLNSLRVNFSPSFAVASSFFSEEMVKTLSSILISISSLPYPGAASAKANPSASSFTLTAG